MRGLAGVPRKVSVKGFIAGGALALLVLLCADELFAAAVLAAVWIAVTGAIAVLDVAERRNGR
jgi:alpha-beta hydrolase superfamily lysophospholipase